MLVAAFLLSFVYEVYRATTKAGTSRHDSVAAFAKNNIPLYAVAAIVIAVLLGRSEWSAWIGLLFCIVVILASSLHYGPRVLVERDPGPIDWLEDIFFTGFVFVAAALLFYKLLGITLEP